MDPAGKDELDASDRFDPRMEEVVDSILARFRAGERPSVEECVARYPEAGEKIRMLLPGMLIIEEARDQEKAGLGAKDANRIASSDQATGVAPGRLLRLGEYRLLHEVGRGGMGVVYEAIQESLGRRVALKVLPYYSLLDVRLLERFRREAQAAAKLQHANIVPVYGFGEERSSHDEHARIHYYAMQFVEGRGLDQVLREVRRLRGANHAELDAQRIPESDKLTSSVALGLLSGWSSGEGASREALPPSAPPNRAGRRRGSAVLTPAPQQYYAAVAGLARQAAEALDYAHERGILHRDVKPSNILLEPSGKVWITDFGLAKDESLADLTGPGEILGTLRYMSPESLQGRADRRSDVYGVGVTLYELLTLRPAFDGADRKRIEHQIAAGEPGRPRGADPGIPRDLESIALKAIRKDPGDRYASARDLALDLGCFERGVRVRTSPVSVASLGLRAAKRHRVLAAGLGLLLLSFPAYLLWSWADAKRARSPITLVAADFDGDGDLDLATSNFRSGNVSVVLDPGRQASNLTTYAVGVEPDGIVARDWNQDGMLDLAVADTFKDARTISILLNAGGGRFRTRRIIDVEQVLFGFAAGDLDGDAWPDLAVAASPNKVLTLRNSGEGSFATPEPIEVTPGANGVVAVDCCRGDGRMDLVTANPTPRTISVIENTGGGQFAKPRHYPAGSMALRLTAADLDGDGDLDIATANYGTWDASILLQNADGSFAEPRLVPTGLYIQCVAAADLDGDGDQDLVGGANHKQDSLVFLRNESDGTFPRKDLLPVPGGPTAVVALDWDHDGDLDLLVTVSQRNVVKLLQNGGDGTFTDGGEFKLSP